MMLHDLIQQLPMSSFHLQDQAIRQVDVETRQEILGQLTVLLMCMRIRME